jgi:hypothetical protein
MGEILPNVDMFVGNAAWGESPPYDHALLASMLESHNSFTLVVNQPRQPITSDSIDDIDDVFENRYPGSLARIYVAESYDGSEAMRYKISPTITCRLSSRPSSAYAYDVGVVVDKALGMAARITTMWLEMNHE